jgi:Transcriptional regulators
MPFDLDSTDLQILALMQANARISNADMARELDMAPSAVLERVKN